MRFLNISHTHNTIFHGKVCLGIYTCMYTYTHIHTIQRQTQNLKTVKILKFILTRVMRMPPSECIREESFRDVDIDHTAFEMLLRYVKEKV